MGRLFGIIGASGSGKTTIGRSVFGANREVISTTTRPMRSGEVNGKDYHFIDNDEFEYYDSIGKFGETDQFGGFHYGLQIKDIDEKLKDGDAFVVVTFAGFEQLKEVYLNAVSVYVLTTHEETEWLLNSRGDSNVEARLETYAKSREELGRCDHLIRNRIGELKSSIASFQAIRQIDKPPNYIAVDFDGTIVDDSYPSIGDIKRGAKEVLKKFHNRGGKIMIWTCRTGATKSAAVKFLNQNGIDYDTINANHPDMMEKYGNDPRKIGADLYIDDKTIHGEVNWGEVGRFLGIKI